MSVLGKNEIVIKTINRKKCVFFTSFEWDEADKWPFLFSIGNEVVSIKVKRISTSHGEAVLRKNQKLDEGKKDRNIINLNGKKI